MLRDVSLTTKKLFTASLRAVPVLRRDHVHMNSTKFHTLTEFVKYLGRTGKCRVDETEKGWFISLIQEDPMEKLSTERRVKRDRRAPLSSQCLRL